MDREINLTLILKKNMMDDIVKHSLNDYPKEACGIMIGESRGTIKIVKKVFKLSLLFFLIYILF